MNRQHPQQTGDYQAAPAARRARRRGGKLTFAVHVLEGRSSTHQLLYACGRRSRPNAERVYVGRALLLGPLGQPLTANDGEVRLELARTALARVTCCDCKRRYTVDVLAPAFARILEGLDDK
jgi:hypothetical protein